MESLSVSSASQRAPVPPVNAGVPRPAEQLIAMTPDDQPETSPPQPVDEVVKKFESFVKDIQRNLDFSVDDSSGKLVVKVIDGDSGKLVRQIPSEELLRLSERLEDLRSLLFSEKV